MKKICFIFVGICCLVGTARAAEPLTACPSGYIAVEWTGTGDTDIVSGSCGAGYTDFGTATECTASSTDAICYIYAYSSSYNDTTGVYKYTEPCVYE